MTSSAISVRHVSKQWGTTRAVDDVSFEAAAGTLVVLLGPSGCGKSTTLRLIAGLESASAGRVHIGDQDVTALPPARRQIAMVFQSYALFPHLTVAENIVFGLRVRRVSAIERRRRLGRVAELLGLVNAVINSFRLVDHVVVMTRGGPDNASALLLYYVYDVAFRFWDTAYASALTMVLLVILAAAAVGQFLFLERRIHYQ